MIEVSFSDDLIEICQACVDSCHITDVQDLEDRWNFDEDDSIADWFIRMDFAPQNFYADLHYLIAHRYLRVYPGV